MTEPQEQLAARAELITNKYFIFHRAFRNLTTPELRFPYLDEEITGYHEEVATMVGPKDGEPQ